VHFRAGIGQGGIETYTPRTLIYDLKGKSSVFLAYLGGFGSLNKYNELYEAFESKVSSNWDGDVQTYSEPKVSVGSYQNALNKVLCCSN
jgi:Misato Segment II tubulin-like domain